MERPELKTLLLIQATLIIQPQIEIFTQTQK